MGLWENIKDIGHSFGIKSNLCNKSWLQIDDSGDRITYIFKANNQLHLTKNGLSQIVPWKYFPENERLVIYYNKNEGMSFQYFFIERGVLLYLKADQKGNLLILANERVEKAPKSIKDLGLYYKKTNASRISSVFKKVKNFTDESSNKQIAIMLDKILDGYDNDLLVEHIKYFLDNVVGFDFYYRNYLYDYQARRDYDYLWDRSDYDYIFFFVELRKIIPSFYQSVCLNNYIDYLGETIEYDKYQKLLIDRLIKRWNNPPFRSL